MVSPITMTHPFLYGRSFDAGHSLPEPWWHFQIEWTIILISVQLPLQRPVPVMWGQEGRQEMYPLHQGGALHHCPYPLSHCVQAGGERIGNPPCCESWLHVEPVPGKAVCNSSIFLLALPDTPQPAHLLLELWQ